MLVIGPAGENLVRYACAVSGERVLGRCGVGAVMGSKNIKGLVAYGTSTIPVYNPVKFRSFIQRWVQYLKQHEFTGQTMGLYGSANFVNKCNESGVLPTGNFKKADLNTLKQFPGNTG